AGADYQFKVLCTDNIELDTFELTYSTSLDPNEVQVDMIELGSGQYYYDIVLPGQPCSLYYKFEAEDWLGQTAETLLKTVEVKDIAPPMIEDLVFGETAYTGDEYLITATVRDDTLLSYARVYYYLGDEEPVDPMVAAAENAASSYTFTIMVPDSLLDLHFKVVASDDESNMQAIGWITIGVMDNDLPEMVEDLSNAPGLTGIATTGDDYMFLVNVSDNIAIGSVMVYYTMPGAEEMSIALDVGTRGVWSYSGMVAVPNDMAGDMLYHFVIVDSSENEITTDEIEVEILDDEAPVPMVDLPDDVYQGAEFTMDAGPSSDNVGIVGWTWAFTEMDGTPVILSGESVNYTFEEVGIYEVTLTVSDEANPGAALVFEIDVIDTEPPVALAEVPETIGSEDLLDLIAIGTDNMGVVSYLWTLTLPDGTEVTGTEEAFTYDLIAILGTLTLTLEVEDAMGNYGIAEYEIEAMDLDAPVVMTPSDAQVYEDSLLIFKDAGSYDNIGIVKYEWRVKDEVYAGIGFSRSFVEAGEYNITLTCFDSSNNSAVNWFIVSVMERDPMFDTDGDGMPDVWENSMGLNPTVDDRNGDPDGDLIINILEMEYGTDPLDSDTDGDGLPDNYELKYEFDPTGTDNAQLDPDEDGDSNMEEYLQGDRRNPTVADADQEEEDSSGMYLMIAIALAILVLIIVVVIVMFATKVKTVEEEFPEKEFPHLYKKVETAPKMEAPPTEAPAPPQ
ncbi:MAG: PKD domain-containing protein, partial [Thermoplasmata archaeon]|nr:PKD domain-containing protein [Thermoplasmata archaeon]